MIHARMLALLAIAASLGCASATTGSGRAPSRANIITAEDISASALGGTAYDVIARLRPNFLISRGQTTIHNAQAASAYPNVYVEGVAYGDVNTLKNIDATQVGEIRLYQAWEAQTKFGLGNNAGVIAITIRRR